MWSLHDIVYMHLCIVTNEGEVVGTIHSEILHLVIPQFNYILPAHIVVSCS